MRDTNYEIDASSPVLVTGATGYVAGVLIKRLLDAGVTVHATVRDPSNKDRIRYLRDAADESPGTIQFFKANLMDRGSFHDAAKGCSVVFHTASPVLNSVKLTDPTKQLIEPAVKGTENVLEAVNDTPTVRRVVLTSSVAAINTDATEMASAPGGVLNEEVWNRTASLGYMPYFLSKTLAEQKAWEMAGSSTRWSLVSINPTICIGPGLRCHSNSETPRLIKEMGDGTTEAGMPNICTGFVDVRDVAEAHVAAAFKEGASGRYLVTGHTMGFWDVAVILKVCPLGIGTLPAQE